MNAPHGTAKQDDLLKKWSQAKVAKLEAGSAFQTIDEECKKAGFEFGSEQKTDEAKPRLAYRPFPTHTLPQPLDLLVTEAAEAIGCDESFVALPLLSCVAASIGNTMRLVVKKGWNAPPALWTLIVGESGTAKSPAFKVAKTAIQRHQSAKLKEYARQKAIYEEAMDRYGILLKAHKPKSGEPKPERPEPPILERIIVSDTTVEALAPILSQNPRGLLLQRDELNGWLGSFNQYKSTKGADEACWLSMFDGESITIDRKGEGTVPTHVENALVSITGGIQPAVLAESMGKDHRSSGMAARFLMAQPPRRAQVWTDNEISNETWIVIDALFIKLLEIDFADPEESTPHFIGMSREAKQVFQEFFNQHHVEQSDLTGDSAAAWSKLLGYVPRIALVFHIVKQLCDEAKITDAVSPATIREAIELVTWFKNEASRLYATIDETDDQRAERDLAAWIQRKHGGECTVRQIVQGNWGVKDTAEAEALAIRLVRAGLAKWNSDDPKKRVLSTT